MKLVIIRRKMNPGSRLNVPILIVFNYKMNGKSSNFIIVTWYNSK